MRSSILLILAITLGIWANAQTVVFSEDFELPSLADSVTSSGSQTWAVTTNLAYQGSRADSSKIVNMNDSAVLTTSSFSTSGLFFVSLDFEHICKIEFFDEAYIQVSSDNGATWTKLAASQYMGTSNFPLQGSKFTSGSYIDWLPSQSAAIPTNSWWKHEKFNISTLVGNSNTVKIRFVLKDGNSSGGVGNYGWLIDNIKVTASPSELIPPSISIVSSPLDTIYGIDPVNIKAYISDVSGIDTAFIIYSVNGGVQDTVGMNMILTDTFSGNIPFQGFGRSVCWKILAIDNSPAANFAVNPSSGCDSYFHKHNLPSIATVGTGTSSVPYYIFYGTYQDTRMQQLYTASEIMAGGAISGGNITSLALNIATASSSVFNGFTIKIKQTSATTLSAFETTGFTTVYSANYSPSATGWQTFNFTTPFAWDGVSNILVNFCFDNTSTATSAYYYYTSSSGKAYYAYNSSTAGVSGCDLTTGYSSSYRANIKFNIAGAPALATDGGFGIMTSPAGTVYSSQNTDVKIKIKNFGTDTLHSLAINWKVDGVSQTPVNWTGNLLKDSLSTSITLGSLNFSTGNHTIEFFTSLPNGLSDMNWANDNSSYSFYACSSSFSGTYTLGGTNPDFTSFSNAISSINQCGLTGPVVINVAPGVYRERVIIPAILGISATNTLTFQSTSSDSSLVILEDSATNVNNNYVVSFNQAKYITFKKITIRALGTDYSTVFSYNGPCDNIHLISNHIQGVEMNSINDTYRRLVVFAQNIAYDSITFVGNRFHHGSSGLHFYSTTFGTNFKFLNNYFYNQGERPFTIDGLNAFEFAYNVAISDSSKTVNRGIFTQHLIGQWTFHHNVFKNMMGPRVWEGWIYTGEDVGKEALVYNNYFYGGNTSVYVFDFGGGGTNVKFLNNTFVGNSTTRCVNFNNYYGTGANFTFSNNVIVSTLSAMHLTAVPVNYHADSNIFWTTANNKFSTGSGPTYYTTLAAFRTATGQDAHSIFANPNMAGLHDPHITNFSLKGTASPYSFINTDIDGQARNPQTPDAGCDELIYGPNDAGVKAMASQVFCPGTNNVEVKLGNFGSGDIDSVKVFWSINNVAQTTLNYTTTIPYNSTITVNLGTFNFQNHVSYDLKFWTSAPNGASDDFAGNDTLTITGFRTSFTGTYTIGDATSDFMTPAQAINSINQFGVCGATIFNVKPGTYNGRLLIEEIPGISAINNFTIQSLNNDTSAVITDSATSTANNYIVKLSGAKYVTINNLSLKPKNTATYNNCLVIDGGSKYNTITANLFEGKTNGTTTDLALLRCEDPTSKLNNIVGNRFFKGSHSIYMKGTSAAARLDSVYIARNLVQDFQVNGIYVGYANEPIIDSNIIISSISNASSTKSGIYLTYCYNRFMVTKNTIIISGTNYPVGFFTSTTLSTAYSRGIFANNFISLTGGTTNSYGLRIYPGTNLDVVFNSIYVNGSSTSDTRGINVAPGSSNVKVINNNVVCNYFPTLYEGATVLYSDYNNFYSQLNQYAYRPASTNLIYSSLAALKAVTHMDSNSISYNPLFTSSTDLHTNMGMLNGTAKIYPGITNDIDGETRNLTTPDIGADEFLPMASDISPILLAGPGNGCGYTNAETIILRIKNVGSAAVNGGFSASIKVNNGNVITENITDTIQPGNYVDYSFSTPVDLSIGTITHDSTFTVKAWTIYSQDGADYNDTLNTTLISGYQPGQPTALDTTIFYGTTASLTASGSTLYAWFDQSSSTIPAFVGTTFNTPALYDTTVYQVGVKSTQGIGCVSTTIPQTVSVINFPNNDAGVTAILDPTTDIPSGVKHSLKVRLKNFGVSNLTSANIFYSMNGKIAPVYNWTGNLAFNSYLDLEVDSLNPKGGIIKLKVWTSLPNNITDSFPTNDTSSFVFKACMNGVYTVGNTIGKIYDFESLTQAKTALVAAGLCGPVTFSLDTGIYNEQVSFPEIATADQTNTVTIEGASTDSTQAILRYTPGSADNYVLRLDGADYYSIRKISIENKSTSNGYALVITNDANHNLIESNNISSSGTSGTSTAGIYSGNSNEDFNIIINNSISGGYHGIYWYGSGTTSWEKGNVISGNTIKGFYYYGLNASYQDSTYVVGNRIGNPANSPTQYGLNAQYFNNFYTISKNIITLSGTSTNYGLRDYYGNYYSYNANPTGAGTVSNNMVTTLAGTSSYGIYSYYCSGSRYYFNTAVIETGSQSAFYHYNTISNLGGIGFKNNIFVTKGTGYAAYLSTNNSIFENDYNNYYTNGATLVYWGSASYASLQLFQAASLRDFHSTNLLPSFYPNNDLHLLTPALMAKGVTVAAIGDDIDGEIRPSIPTIGADEYIPRAIDAGIFTILTPGNIAYEYDTIAPKVVLCNYGTDTLTSIPIVYTVNTGQTVNYTYNVVVPGGECDTIYLPTFVSPLGNVNICTETNLINDSAYFNDGVCKSYTAYPYKDVKLSSVQKLDEGCDLSTDTLRIMIVNKGIVQVNGGLTAYYKVNNGSTVSQAVTNSINVNDSIMFKFSTPINLAVTTSDSIYNIISWLDYVGDNIADNDSITTQTKSFHTPNPPTTTQLVQIPYATTATLTAVSTDSVLWYDSQYGGNKLHEGASYTTGINYTDDSVFVEARGGGAGIMVDAGTGTTSNGSSSSPTPYKNYYWGSKEQYMLTAQELTALGAAFGPVTSIGFNVQAVNACPSLDGFTIKLAHTTQANLTSTYITGNFTTVYSSPSYQPVTGWNIHQFQTPFIWDGNSNIVVEICSNNSSWLSAGNASVYNSTTSGYYTTYTQADNSTVCSNTTGTITYTRPNMKVELAPTGCPSQRVPVAIDVLNIPAYDLGVYSAVSPVSSVYMGSQEVVSVKIKNYGDSTVNTATIAYQIDNQTPVVETINNMNLASQDTLEYIFNTLANLNTPGMTYNFKSWITLANDVTPINDTTIWAVTNQIPSYCVSAALYTSYYDIANVTFAGINNTSPTPYTALYTDYTSANSANIAPGNSYPISIDIQTSTTSSTPGYCKVFIDFDRNGLFDAATETAFESGFNAGGGLISGTALIPATANLGLSKMRVVAVYNGTSTSVLPCGTYSYGETEDYSVVISPLIPQDMSVESISSPANIVVGNTLQTIVAKLKNVGSDSIIANFVKVKLEVNNVIVDSTFITTTLLPTDTFTVSFANVMINQGYNSVCIYSELNADTNLFNNEKCKAVFGKSVETVPYTNNFDGANYWYNNGAIWQNGVPAGTVINTAHTAPSVWKTMLSGNYPNSAYSYIESPNYTFNQVPGPDKLVLKFWHTMDCETTNDGGRIQYSVDGGQNWASLGYATDPQSTNWYNNNNGGTHQWSGSIPWQQAIYRLDSMTFSTATQVQFRFLFTSSASTNSYDGWAIDDFELIYPQQPQDAGVVAIITPGDSVAKGSTYPVKVAVKNYGTQVITSVPVKFKIGTSTTTETFTPATPINPNQVDTFTFNQTLVGPTANFTLCSWTALTNDVYSFNDSTCKNITATKAPWDIAIGQIVTPGDTTKASHNSAVSVYLKNLGSNTITSVPMKYSINNIIWAQETASVSIVSGDSALYTFTNTYTNVLGNYTLCIVADLPSDGDTTNDFSCKQVFGKNDVGIENFVEANFKLMQNIPNPAKGNTRFEFETPASGKLNFSIVNTLGQEVIGREISAIQGLNKIELELSGLSQGIYYYSIEMEGHRLTRKLIVSE